MKVFMRSGRNVFTFLSSTMFKNQSQLPSEEDELDPTSRLDKYLPNFVQNFVFTDSFQPETNQVKTATSMLRKIFLRTDSVNEIN